MNAPMRSTFVLGRYPFLAETECLSRLLVADGVGAGRVVPSLICFTFRTGDACLVEHSLIDRTGFEIASVAAAIAVRKVAIIALLIGTQNAIAAFRLIGSYKS